MALHWNNCVNGRLPGALMSEYANADYIYCIIISFFNWIIGIHFTRKYYFSLEKFTFISMCCHFFVFFCENCFKVNRNHDIRPPKWMASLLNMQTHARTIQITERLGEKGTLVQISIFIVFSSKTNEYKITTHPIKFSMYTRKIVFLYQRRNMLSIFIVSQKKTHFIQIKSSQKAPRVETGLMTCRIETWWCICGPSVSCRHVQSSHGLRHVPQISLVFCRFY